MTINVQKVQGTTVNVQQFGGESLSSAAVVADINELKEYSGVKDVVLVADQAYYFDYDSALASFDNGMTFASDVRDGGYVRRLYASEAINASWYGISTSTETSGGRLTALNHVKLQAAIDYASANGVWGVYIPSGTYLLDRPVFAKSNISVFGDGYTTVLKGTLPFTEAANGGGFFDRCQIMYVGYFQQVDFGAAEKSSYSGATEEVATGLTLESFVISGTTATLTFNSGDDLSNVLVNQIIDVNGLSQSSLNTTYNINTVNDTTKVITITVPSGSSSENPAPNGASCDVLRNITVISLADTGNGNIVDEGASSCVLANSNDAALFSVGDIVALRSDFSTYVPKSGGFAGSDVLEFRKVISIDGTTLTFDRAFTRNVPKYNRSTNVNAIAGDNKSFLYRMGVCSYNGTAAGVTNYGDEFSSKVYTVQNFKLSNIRLMSPNGFGIVRTGAYDSVFENMFVEDVNSAFIVNGMSFCRFSNIKMDRIHDRILESAEGCHDNIYENLYAVRDGVRTYAARSVPMVVLRDRDTLVNSTFVNADYSTYNGIPTRPSLNPGSVLNGFKNVPSGFTINGINCNVDNCVFEGYIRGVFATIGASGNRINSSKFVSYTDPTDENNIGTGVVILNDSVFANFNPELSTSPPDSGEVYLNSSSPATLTGIELSRYDADGNDLKTQLDQLSIGSTFTIKQDDEDGSVLDLSFTIGTITYNVSGYYDIGIESGSIEYEGAIDVSLAMRCTIDELVSSSNFLSQNVFDLRPSTGLGSTAFLRSDGSANVLSENTFYIKESNDSWVSSGSNNTLMNNTFLNADPVIATTVLRDRNNIFGNVSPSSPNFEIQSKAKILAASILSASSNFNNIYSNSDPISVLSGTGHIVHGSSNAMFGATLSSLDSNNLIVGVNSAALGRQNLNVGSGNIVGGTVVSTGATIQSFTAPSTINLNGTVTLTDGDAIIIRKSNGTYTVLGTLSGDVTASSTLSLNQDITGYVAVNGDKLLKATPGPSGSFLFQASAIGTGIINRRATSLIVGRFNDQNNESGTLRFAIGTGTSDSARVTSFYVDDSEIVGRLPMRAYLGYRETGETAFDVLSTDSGKLIRCTASANTTVSLLNSIDVGLWCRIYNDLSSGSLTLSAEGTIIGSTGVSSNDCAWVQKIDATTWLRH